MINSKELRLDNIIYASEYNTPEKVIGIYQSSIEVDALLDIPTDDQRTVPSEHCRGILLTEEWLRRLGFRKSYHEFIIGNPIEFFIKKYEELEGWSAYKEKYGQELDLSEVKYVHQLQNLYFALTGEELTIKQ